MQTNPELELAWQCVEKTGTHLFLTGKAGTGKTTFLRKLKEQSPKRMIVVAPTGIAAINAGGVTIHSFFQLSFAPYIPETTFNTKKSVYKFGKEKIKIIRSIDLLVIDEVSMVRADLLDAIDAVLRRYRDKYKPFGGVQLLLIGDLQQLAPVVKDDEWALLNKYYTTPYFFGSIALKNTTFITIQLELVYRQTDDNFLALLNRIRTNNIDHHLLAELNKRYIPGFHPKEDEGYITLTTHNYQAQRINDNYLALLPGQSVTYKAEIQGVFPETAYPAEVELVIKPGAQIMFIKNDSSNDKRYYNGKIGEVISVEGSRIRVRGKGEDNDFLLEKEEWSNSKYTLNEESKEITEVIEGTFKHYPIRLAWAITIHKSQGLTFERAIIDASMSFTHGQTYVALSRCKTLEGIILRKPLTEDAVICDETVNNFTRKMEKMVPDNAQLNKLMKSYFYDLVCEQFDYNSITRYFSALKRLFDEFFFRLYPKLLVKYKESYQLYIDEIEKVSNRFKLQYSSLIDTTNDYSSDVKLQERIKAGAKYFLDKTEEIVFSLIRSTHLDTDNKELKKKYTETYDMLNELLIVKTGTLANTSQNGFNVTDYQKKKAYILLSLSDKDKNTTAAKKQKKKAQPQQEKVSVPTDILHPELYTRLVRWRKAQIVRINLPAYVILQQKALMGITNLIPTSAVELEKIPHLGKKSIEKYGEALIAIVSGYVKEYGIPKDDLF
jgi:ATP-dependent exoDNAse (exonuclease V), alpha subunit - helicase superfamily I member